MVALVGGGKWGDDDDPSNDRAAGMTAMAGVTRNIKRSRLSRRDVDEMYAETIELVYRGEERGV